jgi:hypothetical protein
LTRRRQFLLALTALAYAAGSQGAVVYVNPAAPGPAHDGSTWATAYTDLQAALAAAAAGSEVWVAAATYQPHASDRGVSFALKDGVGIYGGFGGAETLRTQRDPAAHLTTLSGEIATGAPTDNSYHVVTAEGTVTASAILDGFAVAGGYANGAASTDQRGGGMLVSGGSPTLSNLKFSGNYASDRGGAVRVESGAPSVTACSFESNSSGVAGGGLSSASATALPIRSSVFKSNATGAGRGGGIDANRVAASNCLVVGNSPNGVSIAQDGASLVNCTLTGNPGYGLALLGGPNNTVANSIIFGNATGEIFLGFSAGFSVSYSDIHASPVGGAGLIDANPLFQNAGSGDYRLGSASPAVDAGSNAAAAGLVTDLGGLPRFFNDPLMADSGSGTAPVVDMGAYERVPLTVSDPAGQSVCAGTAVSLSVTASGQPTLSYRWRKGGSDLAEAGPVSGAATDTLTIDPAGTGNSGSYDVRVTDGLGQIRTSGAATVTVNPVPTTPILTAPKSVVIGAAGVAASVPAHAGSTYAWTLTSGSITAGQGSPQIAFSAGPPGTTMALSVIETGTGGCASAQAASKVLVDFTDVPFTHIFHNAIVDVARNGITTGCAAGKYCPEDLVTRGQMAVFILRGKHGGSFVPNDPTGTVFADVSTTTQFARWIELFFQEGITTGCQTPPPPALPLYCPTGTVTRDGMAKFLLLGKNGSLFNPSTATGTVFADVQAGTLLARWMEELKVQGITSGCQTPPPPALPSYCPSGTVNRGEMAKFIRITFGLQ